MGCVRSRRREQTETKKLDIWSQGIKIHRKRHTSFSGPQDTSRASPLPTGMSILNGSGGGPPIKRYRRRKRKGKTQTPNPFVKQRTLLRKVRKKGANMPKKNKFSGAPCFPAGFPKISRLLSDGKSWRRHPLHFLQKGTRNQTDPTHAPHLKHRPAPRPAIFFYSGEVLSLHCKSFVKARKRQK